MLTDKRIIPYWAISAHPFIVDCFAGRLEARDARDSGTTREGRWFIIISIFLSWCKYVNDKYLWNTFGSFHPINMFWSCNFLKFVNYKFRSCVIFYMHVLDILLLSLYRFFLNTTRSPDMYPRDSHWGIFRGYLTGGGFYSKQLTINWSRWHQAIGSGLTWVKALEAI